MAHGAGLVWNFGERVEGYTNLLMTCLMAAACLLFDKRIAVLAIQVSAVPLLIMTAYVTVCVGDSVFPERKQQTAFKVLVFGCTLAYYPMLFWALMGMETGLLTLLVLMSVLEVFKYMHKADAHVPFKAALCLGLAYLTRPDALVLAVPLFAAMFYSSRRTGVERKSLYLLLCAAFFYSAFPLGQLLFRSVYYGEKLPNTFVLKMVGVPLMVRIKDGLLYCSYFLKEIVLIVLIAGAGLVLHRSRYTALIVLLTGCLVSYQIWVGGEPWSYWRFLMPVMPLVIILFCDAVLKLSENASCRIHRRCQQLYSKDRPVRYYSVEILSVLAAAGGCMLMLYAVGADFAGIGKPGLGDFQRMFLLFGPLVSLAAILVRFGNKKERIQQYVVVFLLIASLGTANYRFLHIMLFGAPDDQARLNALNINTSIILDSVLSPEATIGVFQAGTIPYFTGRYAIDFLGKSDKHIALLPPDMSGSVGMLGMTMRPGHDKYDFDYSIKKFLPTYVQTFSWGRDSVARWSKDKYVRVEIEGIRLALLRNSPLVNWEKCSDNRIE